VIRKAEIKKNYSVPNFVKIILLCFIIFGFWFNSFTKKKYANNIIVENIRFENLTEQSVEVIFEINNNTYKKGKMPFYIEIVTNENNVIYSGIFPFSILPKNRIKHVKVINKFNRKLFDNEQINIVNMYLYQKRSFFGN
jgi:hypothetical protein